MANIKEELVQNIIIIHTVGKAATNKLYYTIIKSCPTKVVYWIPKTALYIG